MQLSFAGARASPRAASSALQQWSWLSPKHFSCRPKRALGAARWKFSIGVKPFKSDIVWPQSPAWLGVCPFSAKIFWSAVPCGITPWRWGAEGSLDPRSPVRSRRGEGWGTAPPQLILPFSRRSSVLVLETPRSSPTSPELLPWQEMGRERGTPPCQEGSHEEGHPQAPTATPVLGKEHQ